MKNKYVKALITFMGSILLFSLVLGILNYFHILYSKGSEILIMIFMGIFFFIIGFTFGKKALKKGYLEGLKIGLSLIFLLIIINLLFFQTRFSFERFLYYFILILSSTLGSMFGIQKKN